MLSSRKGHLEIVKKLLSKDAAVNKLNKVRKTIGTHSFPPSTVDVSKQFIHVDKYYNA